MPYLKREHDQEEILENPAQLSNLLGKSLGLGSIADVGIEQRVSTACHDIDLAGSIAERGIALQRLGGK